MQQQRERKHSHIGGNRPSYSFSLSLVGLIIGLMVAGNTTKLPPSTVSIHFQRHHYIRAVHGMVRPSQDQDSIYEC